MFYSPRFTRKSGWRQPRQNIAPSGGRLRYYQLILGEHPRRDDMLRFTKPFMRVTKQFSADAVHAVWAKVDFESPIPGVRQHDTAEKTRDLLEAEQLAPIRKELILLTEQLAQQISSISDATLNKLIETQNPIQLMGDR